MIWLTPVLAYTFSTVAHFSLLFGSDDYRSSSLGIQMKISVSLGYQNGLHEDDFFELVLMNGFEYVQGEKRGTF